MPNPTEAQVTGTVTALKGFKELYTSFSALKSKKFLVTFVLIGVFLTEAFRTGDMTMFWYAGMTGWIYICAQAFSDGMQALALGMTGTTTVSQIKSTED